MSLPTGSKSKDEVTKLLAEQEKQKQLAKKPVAFDKSVESLGLIDETAEFMDSVMRGVAYNEFNLPAANTAGRCADQIYKLMRLKWDVIKALKEY